MGLWEWNEELSFKTMSWSSRTLGRDMKGNKKNMLFSRHFLPFTCMLRYKYFTKNCDVHSNYIHTTCYPVTCCSSVETDLHGHIVWSWSQFVTQVDNVKQMEFFCHFVVIYGYTLRSISVFAAPAWKTNSITFVLFVQNDKMYRTRMFHDHGAYYYWKFQNDNPGFSQIFYGIKENSSYHCP